MLSQVFVTEKTETLRLFPRYTFKIFDYIFVWNESQARSGYKYLDNSTNDFISPQYSFGNSKSLEKVVHIEMKM